MSNELKELKKILEEISEQTGKKIGHSNELKKSLLEQIEILWDYLQLVQIHFFNYLILIEEKQNEE